MLSALSSPRSTGSTGSVTPAMAAVLWEIVAVLDERSIPAVVENAVWLEVPARRLRGPNSRDDNRWLRECLQRLTDLRITRDFRATPWGEIMIADWHLERGSQTARILVPPGAIQALRESGTFTEFDRQALWRMNGPGRRLYVELTNKKRSNRSEWSYTLDDLREVFDRGGRYSSWRDLQNRLLRPAIEDINTHAPVTVTPTPVKDGRRIVAVRLAWAWKTPARAEIWDAVQQLIVRRHGREAHGWLGELTLSGGPDNEVVLLALSPVAAWYTDTTYGRLIRELWAAHDPAATVTITAEARRE